MSHSNMRMYKRVSRLIWILFYSSLTCPVMICTSRLTRIMALWLAVYCENLFVPVFHFRKHIPHAQFFDIFKGATNTATHNRNIPPPEAFQEQARVVGINDDDHIIVYDSIPGKFGLFLGSRTWWMFRVSIKRYLLNSFLILVILVYDHRVWEFSNLI